MEGATIDGVTLSVVSWYEKKTVTVLPNFDGSESVSQIKRFPKRIKNNQN